MKKKEKSQQRQSSGLQNQPGKECIIFIPQSKTLKKEDIQNPFKITSKQSITALFLDDLFK